jgi:DNA polymerase-3 subunit alpha
LLDGSGDGELWAKRAKEIGMNALALTDHGTLSGILEHIAACNKAGVFPILGCEVYFRESRHEKPTPESKRYHLTLLAMNYEGWLNLQRLTSEAYASGFAQVQGIGYKPHVDWELLARYSKGIYCISGCYGGRLSALTQQGYEPEVLAYVTAMQSIYGRNFSLEIQHHDFDGQRKLNIDTFRIANETGVPLTATGDPHYPFASWANMNDIMFMLSSKMTNEKRKRKSDAGEEVYTMASSNPTLYLMNGREKLQAYSQFHPMFPQSVAEQAIAHSGEIVSGFEPIFLDHDVKMPKLTRRIISKIDEWSVDYIASVSGGDESWIDEVDDDLVKKTLGRWAHEGLENLRQLYPPEHWQKYPEERYRRQIEHELAVFDKIGIHVWRYMTMAAGEVRWARHNDIIVGPGRGSAAGSLVAYLVETTDIDPISYNLMFERFINENRKGMPDIDIDFMPGPKGKERVKNHSKQIYGDANVVDIAAFGTYAPRKAIMDVCRVFDDEIDYQTADRIRKAIDLKATEKLTLDECAEKFPELREFKELYPYIWEVATRIQGAPYSQSAHASGVLIKPPELEIATAYRIDKNTGERLHVTAWPDTKELLAAYGWLKLDFLVIDGLVRQYEVIQALRERENTPIDLRKLAVRWDPYAVDPRVMQQFSKGATLRVWQMEGKGTIPVLKSVKPDNMHDLAAINALIRPGPRESGMTEKYAKIKNGELPLTFWHDSLEDTLRKTYGLMIYQEQAMEISVLLGGFTRTEADDLRKAMGKKYREGMEAVKKFLRDLGYEEKFIHNASKIVGEEKAIEIWNAILAFGGYSFNASHAYAYALISYHDMLLKVMAPADFYAWSLTFTKSAKLAETIAAVVREGSRFGIKITPPDINESGLGFKVLDKQTILYGIESVKHVGPTGAREIFDNRPYISYDDFAARVPARAVNKTAKESLIGVGAFDRFGMRAFMSDAEKASAEEAYIGMRITGKTNLEKYAEIIEEAIHTEGQFDEAPDGAWLCVGGEITNVKHTRTRKNGDPMGFINCQFGLDSYRVTCFPQTWERYNSIFRTGSIVLFEGKKEVSDQYGAGFIAMNVITIEEWEKLRAQKLAEMQQQNGFMPQVAA